MGLDSVLVAKSFLLAVSFDRCWCAGLCCAAIQTAIVGQLVLQEGFMHCAAQAGLLPGTLLAVPVGASREAVYITVWSS